MNSKLFLPIQRQVKYKFLRVHLNIFVLGQHSVLDRLESQLEKTFKTNFYVTNSQTYLFSHGKYSKDFSFVLISRKSGQ